MHVASQRGDSIRFLGYGLSSRLGGPTKDLEGDGALQSGAVGKAAVERGNTDPGAAGDLVERRVGALFDEDVTRCLEEVLPIAPGVGAQPLRIGGNSSIYC
jgi:hypothetical protein